MSVKISYGMLGNLKEKMEFSASYCVVKCSFLKKKKKIHQRTWKTHLEDAQGAITLKFMK